MTSYGNTSSTRGQTPSAYAYPANLYAQAQLSVPAYGYVPYSTYNATNPTAASQLATAATAPNFLLTSSTANAMQQAFSGYQSPYTTTASGYTAYPMGTQTAYATPRASSSTLPSSSLWIGDLESWMDESFLWGIFGTGQEILSIKIIRDKEGKRATSFGFIYFSNTVAAQRVLDTYNNQLIPGTTNKYFRLNYASPGAKAEAKSKDGAGSLFVGDLGPEVNDTTLMMTFKNFYPSVLSARIVYDSQTGQPKGFGFVTFGDENDKLRALNEMQGYIIGSRPIKVNLATKKGDTGGTAPHPAPYRGRGGPNPMGYPPAPFRGGQRGGFRGPPMSMPPQRQRRPNNFDGENDPNNLTVFIGGIDETVSFDAIQGNFGPIVNIKFPTGKTCAFVEFAQHDSAVNALRTLGSSTSIGNAQCRLAWGKPSVPSSSTPPTLLPEKRKIDQSVQDTSPPQQPTSLHEEDSSAQPPQHDTGLEATEAQQEVEPQFYQQPEPVLQQEEQSEQPEQDAGEEGEGPSKKRKV